jgi:hypothetical protein
MSARIDTELAAIRAVIDALEPLDDVTRERALGYLCDRFGVAGPWGKPQTRWREAAARKERGDVT